MTTVHIFVSTGRFHSFSQVLSFIQETYTSDGDGVPSAFMREIDLHDYEPWCIEAIHFQSGQPVSLQDLLVDVSYSSQWLHRLDGFLLADTAICVFPPNVLLRPHDSSLKYIGEFGYVAT